MIWIILGIIALIVVICVCLIRINYKDRDFSYEDMEQMEAITRKKEKENL